MALLASSSLVAEAVEYRTTTKWVANSNSTYPECNDLVRITEERDPYLPNVWHVRSVTVIDTTCGGVE